MDLRIRAGEAGDIDEVLALFDGARRFMRSIGNTVQWVNGYPSRTNVEDDIARNAIMVCEDAATGEIVAAFCMQTWPEHTYAEIFDGAWPDQMPYGTVHRLASKYQGKGIGGFCLDWAKDRFGTLRADTHESNIPMQRALEGAGFTRCGIVYMDDRSPRVAFHWKRG